MDSALATRLGTSLRKRHFAAFNADDGLTTDIIDLGVGESAVCLQIETALDASTVLTFLGRAGGDDEAAETIAAADLDTIMNHVSDGSTAASAYSFVPADSTGVFPLDAAVFHGVRYLQIVSDQDNSDAIVTVASKPV